MNSKIRAFNGSMGVWKGYGSCVIDIYGSDKEAVDFNPSVTHKLLFNNLVEYLYVIFAKENLFVIGKIFRHIYMAKLAMDWWVKLCKYTQAWKDRNNICLPVYIAVYTPICLHIYLSDYHWSIRWRSRPPLLKLMLSLRSLVGWFR